MSLNHAKAATRIIVLLLAWCPAPAAADLEAGVAAYKQSNFTVALMEFEESANRDDVRALNYLGIMYAEGIGTLRNDAKAAVMFTKAALLGFPEAMANMGRMHAEGRGVPQDNNAAIAAYSAAARNGFRPAISRMMTIYEQGELGVMPDAVQAREWRAQLSAPPVQSVPAAAVAAPGATDAIATTQPAEPVESPDTVAPAGAARARLQEPQTQTVEPAPPPATKPVTETIAPAVVAPEAVLPETIAPETVAPETIAPAAVTPQPEQAQAPEPQTPSLPETPPPVAVAEAETIPAVPPPEPTQPAAPGQNVIESIVVTLQSDEILIRVRTQTPLEAPPAEFVVATPPRIVFDFPYTITDLGRHYDVGEGDLQSVDVISGNSRTRVVLILRNGMEHEVTLDGSGLLIRLKSIPATSSNVRGSPRQ